MASILQSRNLGVEIRLRARVRGALQTHIGKDAVVAIHLGRPNGFSIHRRNSLALLASRLGDQLLQPRSQIGDFGRSEEGDLVAPGIGRRSQQQTKLHSGIVLDWLFCAGHTFGGLVEQLAHLQAGHGSRHHAEIRQRRVAPADLRVAIKDVPETVVFPHLLHLRAGIGNGHKMAADIPSPHDTAHLLIKKLLQNVGLECGTRFTRHDHQRLAQVHRFTRSQHLRWIRGVDNVQRGKTLLRAESLGQNLRTKAGTAHAQQQNRFEVCTAHVAAQLGQRREVFLLALDNIDPAHPLLFAIASPQRGILLPKTVDLAVGLPIGGSRVHGPAQFRWNCESKAHMTIDSPSKLRLHGKDCAKVVGNGSKDGRGKRREGVEAVESRTLDCGVYCGVESTYGNRANRPR